jgi:hypothetical protein
MNSSESREDSRVVEVGAAPNEVVAAMWRQILEDEGIIVALKPGGAGFALGSSALMEHFVLVREDQAERARAIIAELESETSDEESS